MSEATEPRVLVVEEGTANSTWIEPLLAPLGLRVVSSSSERGIEALLRETFVAVLVHLEADGQERAARFVEATSVLQSSPPRPCVPTFFLVSAEPSDPFDGYIRHGLDYLHNPVDALTLLTKLGPPLEAFRLREQLQQRTASLGQQEALYRGELALRAEAESAMRAREEVLAIVSHDLRNPMSAILASSSMIARKVGPELHKQLQMIERSVSRMQKLVSDLLEELRIEAGQLAIDRHDHDAVSFVCQAVESMKVLAEQKALTLSCSFQEESMRVSCDLERVFQVLSNLVGNAVNFTSPGGRVEINVTRENDEVRFSICDNGSGISPEQLPHIFNRYWQASYTGRKGIGLGLSIAKGIILAHGGRIWVESELGVGTTFHFTLPLARQGPIERAG